MNPRTWEATGHLKGFSDSMVDCKECKSRFRADKMIEEATGLTADGKTPEEISLDSQRDFWLNADEALKYGCVDEIVKSNK